MVRHLVLRYCGDTRAATAVEYGLLLALLVLGLVGAVTAAGGATADRFNRVNEGYPE
ncbi:Flp family type IVb pilin [Henriciella aquimarina]|uniref:Flp family type IVb pilin n=1 Tax=Henriciella aquimarina TaxID=545261 RepID=UPI00117A3B61|nr:Flp family type IVb pilin [Henriciella aquimarina]